MSLVVVEEGKKCWANIYTEKPKMDSIHWLCDRPKRLHKTQQSQNSMRTDKTGWIEDGWRGFFACDRHTQQQQRIFIVYINAVCNENGETMEDRK